LQAEAVRLENLAPEIKGEQQTSSMSRQELVTALQSCRAEQVKMAATVQSLQQANRALQSKCEGMEARGGGVMAEVHAAASRSGGRVTLVPAATGQARAAALAARQRVRCLARTRITRTLSHATTPAVRLERRVDRRAGTGAADAGSRHLPRVLHRGSAPGSAPLSARLLLARGWEWR